MKLFSSLEGLSFDIRHVFEGDVYQCASSGICVHYNPRKFSATSETVNHLQPDRTVLPYHPSIKSCSSGSIEVWM